MFKLKLASFALSAAMLATSFTPSQAFTPIQVPVQAERAGDVKVVQYRSDREDWRKRRNFDRRDRSDRRDRREYRRNLREARAYHNGHRGYRSYRPGYRQHNGAWFPLAAFATGAIIGGAVAQQPRAAYGGSHVEWCANRYRSYRAYDNTYQPNYGSRRQCNSPY
ncbi:BA14K family protein [Pararhizobium gei]|uniref:BA14K family protein n=1 Tax=Pararhizobium gei TaxID=1395951 RepID=UPI0023DBCF90|nr:BA14K family protein [Rhizobium gei]